MRLLIFVPIFCIFISVLSQVFCFRYCPVFGLLKSVYLGFIVGALSLLIFEGFIFSAKLLLAVDFLSLFAVNIIVYVALSFVYFTFLNLGETGRRVRILRELHNSEEGLSIEDIFQRYDSREIVEKRLNRLINNGQLILRDGRYYIGTQEVLMMAKIITFMKLIVIGKKSEFD